MTKVKVKTLIGSVVTVAFFTVIVAFLLYAFPENVASATGFGPYDGQRIHILRHTGCRVVFTRLADREGF